MRYLYIIVVLALVVSCKQKSGGNIDKKEKPENIDSISSPDIDALSAAIRENPLEADNFYQRAKQYAKLEQFRNAVEDLDIAMKLDSTNPEFYTLQSDFYLALKRPEYTLESLENGIELFPEDTTTLLKLGEYYYFLKNFLKSHEYLNRLLQIDRFNEKAYFTRGMNYLESEDTTKAIQNFTRATEYKPEYYDPYMMLGNVYAELHSELAIDYFKNAIDINKQSLEAVYNLAMFYQDHGMYNDAIVQYHYIIDEIDSENKNAYHNIGYVYLIYLSEYQKAVPFFQKAYEIDPEYANAVYNEGLCYEQMNNFRLARERYKKSMEIVPNFALAYRGLNRLDEKEKPTKK